MERIEIVNADCIDRTRPERYPVTYFWMGYDMTSFLVGKEYPAFTVQDALDTLADWLPDHAPGLVPTDESVAWLEEGARKDGMDPEEYIGDTHIRAGNDSHWIDTPAAIEETREDELIKMLYARHAIHARLSEDGRYIEETENFSPTMGMTYRAQAILQKHGIEAPWEAISEAIYDPLRALEAMLSKSDRMELPGGTILQVTWKPEERG